MADDGKMKNWGTCQNCGDNDVISEEPYDYCDSCCEEFDNANAYYQERRMLFLSLYNVPWKRCDSSYCHDADAKVPLFCHRCCDANVPEIKRILASLNLDTAKHVDIALCEDIERAIAQKTVANRLQK